MNEDQKLAEKVTKIVGDYLKSSAFQARKITDTPTDALSVVNRKYVNMSGVTANRPTGSILGQFYFDTTLGFPVYWNGSTFVRYDGTAA